MSANIIIGIDVGGSTTKIVGFKKCNNSLKLIDPLFVTADDPVTSIYGAFGKFTTKNNISLSEIAKVMVTGVGSTCIGDSIYNLPCEKVSEFDCVGLGGLYISKLKKAIVASLGTGTAFVYCEEDKEPIYLGGTGVGGGTLTGLAKKILKTNNIHNIEELAKDGSLDNIDLKIKDISHQDVLPGFADVMTASNFGKTTDLATQSDFALGLINMVFETIGMLGVFAARNHNIKDIVLTGNLASVSHAEEIFETMNKMFNVNFTIPPLSRFGTVIGAALLGTK